MWLWSEWFSYFRDSSLFFPRCLVIFEWCGRCMRSLRNSYVTNGNQYKDQWVRSVYPTRSFQLLTFASINRYLAFCILTGGSTWIALVPFSCVRVLMSCECESATNCPTIPWPKVQSFCFLKSCCLYFRESNKLDWHHKLIMALCVGHYITHCLCHYLFIYLVTWPCSRVLKYVPCTPVHWS